jgi:hypothetical protein
MSTGECADMYPTANLSTRHTKTDVFLTLSLQLFNGHANRSHLVSMR